MQLTCPACDSESTLLSQSKWNRRANSRVKRARCSRCSHTFFLKQIIFHEQMPTQPEQEYATLQFVYDHFPDDSRFKVAKPVQYIDSSKTIVMEYEKGHAFPVVLAKALEPARRELASRAGMWLFRLHNCRIVDPMESDTVKDAASRLSGLQQGWDEAPGRQDATTKAALALLSNTVTDLDEETSRRVWIHGDFTPDNLLVQQDTIVGLDVAWHSRANPVMDLAPFLNHLALISTTVIGFGGKKDIPELEAAFLLGYSQDISAQQMILLDWYRLYFLLCYRLSSLKSDLIRKSIAKIQINNQLSRLTEELEILLQS